MGQGIRLTRKRLIASVSLLLAAAGTAAILFLLHKYPSPEFFSTPEDNRIILIAHAGGQIDGHTYTNSLEALELSVASGFKFIELDLLLSCDGKIVAAHDWKHFNSITGAVESESCLSSVEHADRRILGDYSPLGAAEINVIFSQDEKLYLVTDKISDFAALTEQLEIPADRLLVEVFSYSDYVRALRSGVRYPMLCIWDKKTFRKHARRFYFDRIAMITLPASLIPELEEELAELYAAGVTIFAFSSNDIVYTNKYLNRSVTGFYTDFLLPVDLR